MLTVLLYSYFNYSDCTNTSLMTSPIAYPLGPSRLWEDADGYPWTSDVSFGVQYQGVLWHYGGKMSWGPDKHIYLSLGDK